MSKNKVILITGAAKRLGRELALGLAQKTDVTLALHYHTSEKEAQTLLKELHKKKIKAELFKADLTQVSEIKKMASDILKKFGKIDVLINNAAIFYPTPFGEVHEKEWDLFLDTNLKGPFFLIQALAGQQRSFAKAQDDEKLKIINIADSGGPKTRANYIPYWISKSGLITLTEVLAKVFGQGIQINTIAPGPIAFAEDLKRLSKDITIDPQEVIKTALHLIQNGSSITGTTIIIDRGRRYL